MLSLKKTILTITVSTILATSHSTNALIYTIIDPARDYSWYMREFKRGLMAGWMLVEEETQEIVSNGLALKSMMNDSAAESEKIVKTTESVSETRNFESDERYTPTPLTNVCGVINVSNKISSFSKDFSSVCKVADAVDKRRVNDLNDNLNNNKTSIQALRAVVNNKSSDQQNSEAYLQYVADMQFAMDKMSNQSEIINETDAVLAQKAIDLIFDDNTLNYEHNDTPLIGDFQRYMRKKMVEYQFESYLHERIERRLAPFDDVFNGTSNPDLVRSMAQQESGGQIDAESPVGAVGIMQFMPATAEERNLDPTDPVASIREADVYMKEIGAFLGTDDIRWQLAGYNWGMGNVKEIYDANNGNFETGFTSLPQETKDYVSNITNSYNERLTNKGKNPALPTLISDGQIAQARSYLLKGSPTATQSYIEDMRKELMSPALWRYVALMKAESLMQDYAMLLKSIDKNRSMALMIKYQGER